MPITTVGVISDAHGLLKPEAFDALRGCSRILHAGDIGAPEILDSLSELAPVTAVRGNNDRGAWAERLPMTAVAEVAVFVHQPSAELRQGLSSSGLSHELLELHRR